MVLSSEQFIAQGPIIFAAIGVKELSWIIEDYCIEPLATSNYRKQGQCVHCNAKHKRANDNLCMDCGRLCLLCKQKTCRNDKTFICGPCTATTHEAGAWIAALGQRKYEIYEAWYGCIDPTKYRKAGEKLDKARAEQAKAEQERLVAFYAAERAKPAWQQINELRAKLIEANAIINAQRIRSAQFNQTVNERPVGPYF